MEVGKKEEVIGGREEGGRDWRWGRRRKRLEVGKEEEIGVMEVDCGKKTR